MSHPRTFLALALIAACCALDARPLAAQGGRIALNYGRWWLDEPANLMSITYYRRALGPIDYGLGLFHFDDRRPTPDLTQSGTEFSLGVGRLGGGPYAFGAASLGIRHVDGNTDAAWTAGVGYQLQVFSFMRLGFEGGYRVEDTGINGFWSLEPIDRRGFMLQGHLGLGGGRRSGTPRSRGSPTSPAWEPPDDDGTGELFTDSEAATLAVTVTQTALDAMGKPYQWGGSDEDGYDCSGLIQWAYSEHGILLPRTSREQARLGVQLDRNVGALRPGDILGFAASGSGVSHVGLYVGSGDFIHSSSAGVRLSSLVADDPDSRWWQQRWVTARRILN